MPGSGSGGRLFGRSTAMLLNAIDNHSHLQLNVIKFKKDRFSMYVCICNGITDKQIRRAAEAGVRDIRQLQNTLGVASGCGSCAVSIAADHPHRAHPAGLPMPGGYHGRSER